MPMILSGNPNQAFRLLFNWGLRGRKRKLLIGEVEGECLSDSISYHPVLTMHLAGLLEIVGVSSILELGCIMGFNGLGVGATRLCQV